MEQLWKNYGKHTKTIGNIHHCQWENYGNTMESDLERSTIVNWETHYLFLWPFSIATQQITRGYARILA